jgi:hypothetical protein
VVRVIRSEVWERILIPLGEGQVAEGEIEGLLRAMERCGKDRGVGIKRDVIRIQLHLSSRGEGTVK